MQIRRLELIGFKSFVSRTRFEFPDGITAVVGPNGCGKSNIVDAIRWVLGEQSPSHLRGRAMEDVIFNGNERTGPLGMAEVSLVLERTSTGPMWEDAGETDDQDSELQRQLTGVGEITVTRRYFRSGESEFYLNRIPCRLRDITQLFLGSGVGTKAYSTIEQGRVEQLVNAKPETLRLFIEEAAGTTRYRSRKVMAERKLERTRENLNRLADVIREIERQISSLTRQAKRAEEYHRCRDQLREVELGLARRRYQAVAREIEGAETRLAPLAREEERLASELEDAERAAATARVAARSAEERQQELQVRIVERRLEGESATQRLGYLDEARDRVSGQIAAAEAEQRRTAVAREQGADDGANAEERVLALDAALREARTRHVRWQEKLGEHEDAAAAGETTVQEAEAAAIQTLGDEVRFRNLRASVEAKRQDLAARLEKARSRRERLDVSTAECRRRREATGQRMAELRHERERAEAVRSEHQRRLEDARGTEAVTAREVEATRAHAAAIASRRTSLQELSTRWEGCARGVSHLVEQGAERVLGVVADVLRVPQAYEAAVAAALGPRLDCLITEDHETAVKALQSLAGNGGGRASFIPRTPRPSAPPLTQLGACSLLDVIEVPERFQAMAHSLLGNVVVVDTLSEAIALWQRNGSPAVFVTKNGELLDTVGMLSGGTERPLEETSLARHREIRELQISSEAALASAREAAERHRAAVQRVEELRRAQDEAAAQLQALQLEHARALGEEERLEQEQRRVTVEREALDGEIRELEEACAESAAQLDGLTTDLDAVRVRKERDDEALRACRAALTEMRNEADEARAALMEAAVEAARCQAEYARAEETKQHAAERAERLDLQCRDLEGRLAQLRSELTRLETEGANVERERDRKLDELTAAESDLAGAAEQAAAATAEAARCEQAVREGRAALESCREERPAIEVTLAELRANRGHLVASMAEKYGEDVTACPAGADAAANLEEEPGDSVAHQQIEALRARLAQIGEVHGGAIDELDELRSRHQFLTQQKEDLQRSIDDLRRTITKLNRLSRTRFRETFDEANQSLQRVFPRLFPGGRAQLILLDAEDGAEPGVQIVVQPAGKKLQTLSLLSGGEKALTAVALILSLFMIRPTPFCVLDEVDAPLDDVNVRRFDQLIREISRSSQFVVITHNKGTMEAADTLYGITMEEPGVSRVVSVRFKQAA